MPPPPGGGGGARPRADRRPRPRAVKLNANRHVTGNLRGFDQFMNIVLDNTVEEVSETERNDIGLVVRRPAPPPRAAQPARLLPNARRAELARRGRRR